MQFFIDTANLRDIKEATELGIINGVTTNPSLMAKEGIKGEANILSHYKAICQLVDDNVSAEVIATDFSTMVKEGRKLSAIDSKIVVKVPITKDGLKAINTLSEDGIRTNCTLVFSAGQALLAAKAGATFVSPFIGRLDDISQEGVLLIKQLKVIYNNYGFKTRILAASIRHTIHLIQCSEIGVDVATCPLQVFQNLLLHPLTEIGLSKFLSDHKKNNS